MANKVVIGSDLQNPLFSFDGASVRKVSAVLSSALSGDELAIDQLNTSLYSTVYIRVSFIPAESDGLVTADGYDFMCYPGTGFLDKLPYGTPVWYYADDIFVGKFYLSSVTRTTAVDFDLVAQSAIGILDGQKHYGGVYTGQTFAVVAADIIGSAVPFSCADDMAEIPIYGWLPIATKRSNLHQLLFANGVTIAKDSTGNMVFQFPDTDTVTNIPDDRIFLGGSVGYQSPATKVNVTEHTYIAYAGDETVTLYDNTESGAEVADNTEVSFDDAPIHDLATTGTLTIVSSNVNRAVVSGVGTLTGKKYTRITKTVVKSTEAAGAERVATVEEATLINTANSENVAKRVLSYYSSARKLSADVALQGERPGDQIAFNNAFGEPETAFLASADISSTSFMRAACELISGYVPSGGGNNYTQSEVLTGSGTWTSPIDGKIRVAIIGGGSGGQGGNVGGFGDGYWFNFNTGRGVSSKYAGTYDLDYYDNSGVHTQLEKNAGEEVYDYTLQGGSNPGVGGNPGNPGAGGKVLVLTLTVTKGQQFVFSCGSGGSGGAGAYITKDTEMNDGGTCTTTAAANGSAGTDTIFGQYSSEAGAVHDYGYLDVLTQTLYAATGDNGTVGGSGYLGAADTVSSGQGPNPGTPGNGRWRGEDEDRWKNFAAGGCGTGGSAYGAPGTPGVAVRSGDIDHEAEYGQTILGYGLYADEGAGVKGATPIKAVTPSTIGKGGTGGHGGGGGSCAGAHYSNSYGPWSGYDIYTYGGIGGNGGEAGDGAPGGIIINY